MDSRDSAKFSGHMDRFPVRTFNFTVAAKFPGHVDLFPI